MSAQSSPHSPDINQCNMVPTCSCLSTSQEEISLSRNLHTLARGSSMIANNDSNYSDSSWNDGYCRMQESVHSCKKRNILKQL